jgi:CRP/FNR family transcriptional regulator, cyclic AMP receptor protein
VRVAADVAPRRLLNLYPSQFRAANDRTSSTPRDRHALYRVAPAALRAISHPSTAAMFSPPPGSRQLALSGSDGAHRIHHRPTHRPPTTAVFQEGMRLSEQDPAAMLSGQTARTGAVPNHLDSSVGAMTSSSDGCQLVGLGADLPSRAWAEVLAQGTLRRYRPGAVLLRQGARSSYVLALVEGRVMITKVTVNGDEMIMAIGDPGEILGDMTVMDQASRTATVTALAPCAVRVLSSEQFAALIDRHEAAGEMARHAFARVREVELIRFEMGTLPVDQRLACALARLTAGSTYDGIELSQDQLARLIGASRNAVVATLTSLRARGIITTSRRRLIVCDPRALRQFAAGDTIGTGVAAQCERPHAQCAHYWAEHRPVAGHREWAASQTAWPRRNTY